PAGRVLRDGPGHGLPPPPAPRLRRPDRRGAPHRRRTARARVRGGVWRAGQQGPAGRRRAGGTGGARRAAGAEEVAARAAQEQRAGGDPARRVLRGLGILVRVGGLRVVGHGGPSGAWGGAVPRAGGPRARTAGARRGRSGRGTVRSTLGTGRPGCATT